MVTTSESSATGIPEEATRIVHVPFGEYLIDVRLDGAGRLIEIVGLKIRRDFASPEEIVAEIGSHDVSDLYVDLE